MGHALRRPTALVGTAVPRLRSPPGGTALDGSRTCPSTRTRWVTSAAATCPVAAAEGSLLDAHQVLQHLVAGGDHLGVRLEPALGDDQVGELLGQVDVA